MEDLHPHVQYLMKVGGFKTYEDYSVWCREPLDDWDEPDWAELALREMGGFDSDSDDDNDPDLLASMNEYADMYLQEKEDRLIRAAAVTPASCQPRIPLPDTDGRRRPRKRRRSSS
jgi:hypothetical protein